jgi:septum formation protein
VVVNLIVAYYFCWMAFSSSTINNTILLASSSPRRIGMLKALGISFVVFPADIDESVCDHLPIQERVLELAELKARSGFHAYAKKNGSVNLPTLTVGADTLVSLDDRVLGKASSEDEAREMLVLLSGRCHKVSTGICVLDRRSDTVERALSETHVVFARLTEREIDRYIASGEWRGVAGAYRIQELAAFFVERVEGSFSGVVGLPLHEFYAILSRSGYPFSMKKGADSVL